MQHRPVLLKVVTGHNLGDTTIDATVYAAELGLTAEQVTESVTVLCDARFIQVKLAGPSLTYTVIRVWPAAAEVLADPRHSTGAPEASNCPPPEPSHVSRTYEQVVLRGSHPNI